MKKVNVNIDVKHVTRLEGHGNIKVRVKDGVVEELIVNVVEAPRFFEAMLRGRRFDEAPHITSRICGICSIGHTAASLRAVEDALGVTPSEQTVLLRKLILHGETLQSHVLHAYFLAAPDLLGVDSVIPLVATHKDVVLRALRLKKLSNDLCDLVGGRTTHPVSMAVNGFTKLPDVADFRAIRKRMAEAIPDVLETVALLKTLELPDFVRETEFVALQRTDEYAFYDGQIASTDGKLVDEHEYRSMTNEYSVPHSTAKFTRASRDAYMVGALARVNNNYDLLSPMAKAAAEELGLAPVCHNPFMNTVAQVVEVAHALEDGIRIMDELLARGMKEEDRTVKVKAGRGVGAVEVPRGILYHDYTIDDKGLITDANCIIPTNQNFANMELDMKALVPTILDRPEKEIELMLEILMRAYDPCISCSVHMLDVAFD
ncbi:MAG: Ni/Fe hydrogenase subunit alpha [Candidatus Latescibacterota bacterium]